MKHHTPSPTPKQSESFVTATETLPSRHRQHTTWKKNKRGLTITQDRHFLTMRRIIEACGGTCDWSRRRLAAQMNLSLNQFDRHTSASIKRGLLDKDNRRHSRKYNRTNLWKLGPLAGGGGTPMSGEEKKELILKTSTPPLTRTVENLPVMPTAQTPPPPPQPRPAFSRSAENHPPRIRERWQKNQEWKKHREAYRMKQAQERNRRALQAEVGMRHTFQPATPPTAEERAEMELFQERERQRQRERLEAQAAQDERTRLEWAEAARKRAESAAEPWTAEELERIARLNRKVAKVGGEHEKTATPGGAAAAAGIDRCEVPGASDEGTTRGDGRVRQIDGEFDRGGE